MAGAMPNATGTVVIQERLMLTLPQALKLAVRNNHALAEFSQKLEAAKKNHTNGLRELRLDVSLAY